MKKEILIATALILAAVSGTFLLELVLEFIGSCRPAAENKVEGLARALDNLFIKVDVYLYYVTTWLAGTWLGCAFCALMRIRIWTYALLYTATALTALIALIVSIG